MAPSGRMKKFALIFGLAVFLPSALLGWLALDSLRNQEFVFERQQELLLQGASDTLAERVRGFLGEKLTEFGNQVDQLASGTEVVDFDERIRAIWPAATVGFVVTLEGKLVAPSAQGDAPAQRFLEANSRFLTNAESAEVYQQPSQPAPHRHRWRLTMNPIRDNRFQRVKSRSRYLESGCGKTKGRPRNPQSKGQNRSPQPIQSTKCQRRRHLRPLRVRSGSLRERLILRKS